MSEELRDVAAEIVADQKEALMGQHMPAPVMERFTDFVNAIAEVHAAGDQFAADHAELTGKKDLMPSAGFSRLMGEARNEAVERSNRAVRTAQASLEGIKGELIEAALPQVRPEREMLARQELEIAMGNTVGPRAAKRVSTIAQHGSREAVAVLFSPFGRTVLSSRGVPYDETIAYAREIVATTAAEKGTTDRERAAGAALANAGKLGAAIGAAGTALQAVIKRG